MIGVDNHTYTGIPKIINHFIGLLFPIKNHEVKRYIVMVKVRGEGKIKWDIEDNHGKVHSIIIRKVSYVPKASSVYYLHISGIKKSPLNTPS